VASRGIAIASINRFGFATFMSDTANDRNKKPDSLRFVKTNIPNRIKLDGIVARCVMLAAQFLDGGRDFASHAQGLEVLSPEHYVNSKNQPEMVKQPWRVSAVLRFQQSSLTSHLIVFIQH
jgi:hypothetical protein